MTHQTQDATFADVALAFGEWLGQILPGLDDALAEIGDRDWSPGTRESVLRLVGHEAVALFDEPGGAFDSTTEADLLVQARIHLARYAIARARAHVIRSRGVQCAST